MSVFGAPLETLVEQQRDLFPSLKVPVFVENAVLFLVRHGIKEEGIFRLAGDKTNTEALRAAIQRAGQTYDLEGEVDMVDVHDVSDVLKLLLRGLGDCLLCSRLFDTWLRAVQTADEAQQLRALRAAIEVLPAVNRAVLERLTFLLRLVAENSGTNMMREQNLGVVWGPNLLWAEGASAPTSDPVRLVMLAMDSARVSELVAMIIRNARTLFPTQQIAGLESVWAQLDTRLVVSREALRAAALVSLQESPDQQVWVADFSGKLYRYDAQTAKRIGKPFDSGQGQVFKMASVGRSLWSTSMRNTRIWNNSSGVPCREIPGFQYSLAVVGDSVWLGGDSTIQIWDPETAECENEIKHPGALFLTLLCAGDTVWAAGAIDSIQVYNAGTGALLRQLPTKCKTTNSLCLSGKNVWSAHDGKICVWNASNFACEKEISVPELGVIHRLEDIGRVVVSCCSDGTIRFWDAATMQQVGMTRPYHTDSVVSSVLVWNKASSIWQLWTVSTDGTLCVWNLNDRLTGMKSPDAQPSSIASLQAATQRKKSRAATITVKPTVLEPARENIVEGFLPKPTRPAPRARLPPQPERKSGNYIPVKRSPQSRRRQFIRSGSGEATKESEPSASQWKAVKATAVVEETVPLDALILAAQMHLRGGFADTRPVLSWFKAQGIVTCGDLASAPDSVWERMKDVLPPSAIQAISSVLLDYREASKKATTKRTETPRSILGGARTPPPANGEARLSVAL